MPALRTRDTQLRSTLEVSTDAAPQAPILTIISPTPRSFTFPITHNLADSPYSSPSNSPFEPDLRSLVVSSTPPPPSLRTLTPDIISSPSSHRRRRSSEDVVEHRPKKGDDDYVKRPENAFILFRRKCCEERQAAPEDGDGPTKSPRQADLSKTISQQWKSLSTEERQYWEELAKEKKKEHAAKHPNYVYRPQRAKDKDGRPKPRKSKSRRGSVEEDDADNLSFVVPVNRQRHYGRSASAPTPPPHQFIQVPNVYQMTPSCPTSPSLMPMISRRSSHSDHSEDGLSFDFRPSEGYGQQFGRLEASLQPSEFLQSMFSMAGFRPGELHPLDVSPNTLLQPHHHQIISPSSSVATSSSGPPSPYSDALTPLSAMPLHSYPHLSTEQGNQSDLDLQMEMQLQQEYAQFNWSNNDTWQGESDLLVGDDFDLNAIPPIELGMPKPVDLPMLADGSEYASQSQSPQDYSLMDPIHFEPFDHMMSTQGF